MHDVCLFQFVSFIRVVLVCMHVCLPIFPVGKIEIYVAVRLCKDRLELVHQALATKPGNYKQSQKVSWVALQCLNVAFDSMKEVLKI